MKTQTKPEIQNQSQENKVSKGTVMGIKAKLQSEIGKIVPQENKTPDALRGIKLNEREKIIASALLIHSAEVLSDKMRVYDRTKQKWINATPEEIMELADKIRK